MKQIRIRQKTPGRSFFQVTANALESLVETSEEVREAISLMQDRPWLGGTVVRDGMFVYSIEQFEQVALAPGAIPLDDTEA